MLTSFKTIQSAAEGLLKEKGSKFFAFQVSTDRNRRNFQLNVIASDLIKSLGIKLDVMKRSNLFEEVLISLKDYFSAESPIGTLRGEMEFLLFCS